MELLPFKELEPYKPRQFVPEKIDFGDWNSVSDLFAQLEQRARDCRSPQDLEKWLLASGELNAALDEEGSRRYIAMTCHTDNAGAEKAYLQFVEEIEPRLKPRQFALAEIYLKHPIRPRLDQERYKIFDRNTRVHVDLFRKENVPLETEEAKLAQQYQKLSGSLTVQFRGEEKTLAQMGRFAEETDRRLRKQTWEIVAKRRLQEADKFDDIFDQLLQLRQQIARNAGFENYVSYAFKANRRFDYTPADCFRFHDAVEKQVMPLVRELHQERKQKLRLKNLRPWDLGVDRFSRSPLRPFERVETLLEGTQRIFNQLDKGLGKGFQNMRTMRLLDLANRKGKAPGGYQSTLAEARLPFIFMNAVGQQRDVETMLHEAGHAFHALATRTEDFYPYRHAPIEFCEVASMAMELLGNEFLEAFYDNGEANRARCVHLEGIVYVLPWIVTVDAFQHWIYSNPTHTREQRRAAWLQLMDRFGGDVNWSGQEKARANSWHRQLHIFLHPFYYIEYGIAQLGALQIWAGSRRNKAEALARYQSGLALGGSRPLPELFEAAGCRFSFGEETIAPLIQLIRTELAKLNES